MSMIFLIIGFAFLFAGFMSLSGLTDEGLYYVGISQLHTLPFLNQYPASWVYTGAGVVILVLAYSSWRGRNRT